MQRIKGLIGHDFHRQPLEIPSCNEYAQVATTVAHFSADALDGVA
jgi:hypothetical protein